MKNGNLDCRKAINVFVKTDLNVEIYQMSSTLIYLPYLKTLVCVHVLQ